MYQLFIANKNYSSWSLRPWVLMTSLNIAFEERLQVFDSTNNWEAFRQFSPSGTVPCLQDGDTTVWDSLAIIEYLAERHQGVWPENDAQRAWARCATAEMHSGFSHLRTVCGMNCSVRVKLHEIPPGLAKEMARLDELWCQGLARFGGPFLTGRRFTAVDAFYAPVAFRVQSYGLELSEPAAAYVATLLSLPAMQSWYQTGIKEPWVDPAHESDIVQFGDIIEDVRKPS